MLKLSDTSIEQWKDIPNYEGIYQASSLGRIQRIIPFPKNANKKDSPVLDICFTGNTGYGAVRLNGKLELVHRIIALSWIENPENKPYINHKDGNRKNNNKDNLEWATKAENNQHAYDTGLRGRNNIIPKVQCPHCDLMIGTNMISRHIKARHGNPKVVNKQTIGRYIY